MDAQQVLANDPKVVEAYFDLLEDTIKEHNIVPEKIYNMDKTGFLLGQSQSCNIIVPKENGKNRHFQSHPGNRETITVVECIGAHSPPPLLMVIFKGKTHQQTDFIQQAWESRIVCLCLPPHATHLLQPLDVSIFGPLQKAFTTEVDKFAGANLSISKKDFLSMYIKARQVITGRATAKAFKDVGIDSTLCHETVLNRMPAYHRESTPPLTPCPMPEDTPTPSTSAEAKQLMAQLFQSLAQHEEQLAQQEDQLQASLQATLLLTQHQWRAYLHKFGRFADWLFNQQVLNQAWIQELTVVHTNKQRTGTGDRNQLSKARVLHQSDLPWLLAEREEHAQREAAKQSRKQARKKSTATSPALDPPEQAPAPQLQAAESSAQANTFMPPPPPPFPGYDYLMGLSPLSPPLPSFPSSSSVCYDLPGPSWHPAGPSMPPMPPFM
ncbi:related to transposase [Sporisorium reilianum f. sp. reilianum]|uniref:Related to transposase n=1 Tax=Sporisorium reilianum f. sp. reilianum TaxID=72559 RepID=A0A2N8UDC4_9BASI|nr:related to transposase [Sporisorium reilianum f. sp. reilianum]